MDPALSTGELIIPFKNFLKKVKFRIFSKDRNKKDIGKIGENAAAKFLIRKGYRILERNWRIRGGEIDIVATDGDTVVFVEVKSRTSTEYGTGEEAITSWKIKRLINAAQAYLRYKGEDYECRFDVISILFNERGRAKEINHIQDAFTL